VAFMNDSYIIETARGAAGIVVRDGAGFRFFAAAHAFAGMEGQFFCNPKAAETAARRCETGPKPRAKADSNLDLALQWSS
jgi:hypothetical protein